VPPGAPWPLQRRPRGRGGRLHCPFAARPHQAALLGPQLHARSPNLPSLRRRGGSPAPRWPGARARPGATSGPAGQRAPPRRVGRRGAQAPRQPGPAPAWSHKRPTPRARKLDWQFNRPAAPSKLPRTIMLFPPLERAPLPGGRPPAGEAAGEERSAGPMQWAPWTPHCTGPCKRAERLPAAPWGPAPQRPGTRFVLQVLYAPARPRLGVEPHAHGPARRLARRLPRRRGAHAPVQSQPRLAHRTWSGAWLRPMGWLAQEGGAPGDFLGDSLRRIRGALASGTYARGPAHQAFALGDPRRSQA
jgi:hypothetical protein